MRKPTAEEELQAWHALMWRIDFCRSVSMNHADVVQALNKISHWVAAHSTHNGERPDSEVRKNVNAAFWNHIAGKEPPELKKPGRPKKTV